MQPSTFTFVIFVMLIALTSCHLQDNSAEYDGWIVGAAVDRKDGEYQWQQMVGVWSSSVVGPRNGARVNCAVRHSKKAIRISNGWKIWTNLYAVKVMTLKEDAYDSEGNCYGFVRKRNWAERK